MLPRTPLPPVILADYLRSAWSVFVTAVLWLSTVPAFGQDIRFSNRLLDRAHAGHVEDQLRVARAFQLGLGVERNAAEAAQWFLKAADQGNPVAQDQLGLLYLLGLGVQRDDREAVLDFGELQPSGISEVLNIPMKEVYVRQKRLKRRLMGFKKSEVPREK